ncbi:siderophore-interacting protein [Acidimangrovimonas sediminis]|uniref:siderophore-interacting protein n=1 Tax=Acidimangrovimonas sediminis TaxID=2056283 RepID=UPI000C7FD10A|nr:siderophore-interacting protein [Acidimangrovimonas sediminis]
MTTTCEKEAVARLEGQVPGGLPEGLLPAIAEAFAEYDFPVTHGAQALVVDLPLARLEILCDGLGLQARVAARNAAQLQQAREGLVFTLDRLAPGTAARLRWSGDVPRNARPANFHHATLREVRPVGASFLRVEVDCPGTARLCEGGMHFGLCLPPAGRAPVWPVLDGDGRTVWPEGADTLHRAAYTFVDLDPQAGRFSFDVYRHAGGRCCGWVEAACPGDVLGVTGPGGGDFPPGDHLLIAGDETALPAIRRILALSDPGRRGLAILETADPGDRLPLAAPAGMAVEWVTRGEEALWDRLADAPLPPPGPGRFVWVAGEQALARRAKAHFRDHRNLGRGEGYFAGYWQA